MAKHWKEHYSLARATELNIHDYERVPVVGIPPWTIDRPDPRLFPKWIYFVKVCGFTFGFFSLDMMRQYRDFFARKLLPTSRVHGVSPFASGPAKSSGSGQSMFERLPMRLRQESKRVRVLKALERALQEFGRA